MTAPLTSRKTEREVRLRLDRLDEVLLRKIIREELEAHEARKDMGEHPMKYCKDYDWRTQRCACDRFHACVGFGSLGCGRAYG